MPGRLTVGQAALNRLIQVRILAGQQREATASSCSACRTRCDLLFLSNPPA